MKIKDKKACIYVTVFSVAQGFRPIGDLSLRHPVSEILSFQRSRPIVGGWA